MPDIRDIARPSLETMLDQLKDESPELYARALDQIEKMDMSSPRGLRVAELIAKRGLNAASNEQISSIANRVTTGLSQGIPAGD